MTKRKQASRGLSTSWLCFIVTIADVDNDLLALNYHKQSI